MIPMNGNSFFEGIVEDVNDPSQLGRVRVRILGVHTDNKALLPTEYLPWANVVASIYSASISGVGHAPVGMVNGTMVFGLFKDGMNFQEPIVMGTLGGHRETYINSSYGFNDPDGKYPKSGVDGDVNKLAGGSGDTGARYNVSNNMVQTTIPGAVDVTEPVAILDTDAYTEDTPWMPFALAALGVNEKDNPDKIKEYHKVGGGYSQEPTVAWCAAFTNWCLIQAGITGTRSASARSFMKFAISSGKETVPYGSIAVFGVPNSGSGHVGFVLSDKGDKLEIIGGNQSDKSHNSGGKVSKTNIPKNGTSLILLDCRMPTNMETKK